jgi:hypothetical protein
MGLGQKCLKSPMSRLKQNLKKKKKKKKEKKKKVHFDLISKGSTNVSEIICFQAQFPTTQH